MPTFPTLSITPNYPLKEDREDAVIRSEMEGGYSITRRRFSRTRRLFTLGYENLVQNDKDLLDTFFDDTIDGGAIAFDWVEPASSTVVVVRFTKPPIFSLDFFGDEYRYSTSIELQEQ
jgi:hypothetical protein